jgi:transcriptional regulator with XRE-family HTH domain
MSKTSTPEQHIHQGRNIKRYREMMGIKQQAMAIDLGDDWNQKKVSRLEEKEVIDKELLQQVSKVLNIPMETLENQDAEKAMINIQNNYEGAVNNASGGVNNGESGAVNVFNPYEKIVELHERLLVAEKEKNDLLQQSLDKLK